MIPLTESIYPTQRKGIKNKKQIKSKAQSRKKNIKVLLIQVQHYSTHWKY